MTEDDPEILAIDDKVRASFDGALHRIWLELLSHENGRWLLYSILDKCQMWNFGHHGNEADAVIKGRQQIGAEVLAEFVWPKGMKYFTDMLLEAERREKSIAVAIEAEITKEKGQDT